MAATILIVDDEPDIREMIGEILADEDYLPVLAADAEEARVKRETSDPDLILLDVWMPDSDGISLLREWREQDVALCPVVMISGHGSVEAAVEATRFGASDFIEKPVSMARLLNTVRKALASGREPGSTPARAKPTDIPEPLGRSDAITALRERAETIERARGHVLITGEPGSGRSTLARWLHAQSGAADATLHECAMGPGKSELAGLETSDAEPVTLILEHFESIGADDRAHLGRLLASASSAVRVLAITTPGLAQHAASGRFDNALYQRVAESVLEVPALRQRREDIPELVRYLAERLPVRENLPYRPVPVSVQNLLRQHDWPGNLRELANLLRRLLQAGSEAPVEPEEVAEILDRADPGNTLAVESAHSPLFELPLREAREAFERQYLITRLKRAEGSVGQLAEAVEMERTHLYRKLRQLGIDPKQVQEDNK
ncbi:MAG: sigma-54-dependent Fis family transcriptional regulator [Wenzhouxiangellaceae bacterium]|nr:sigma-54-dependent Fis family transcriptional regulator [Wenzhouxiangellaceae bacterium]MBS3745646.1 sigma-54-dependent Fis family transcriptional regulator [Wenzhouxiangellaceae bacterium]MBS3822454.1 sigma-54-dependent Fis family transcriptional regulator [Wenzhouxiangellaceae bacterium]